MYEAGASQGQIYICLFSPKTAYLKCIGLDLAGKWAVPSGAIYFLSNRWTAFDQIFGAGKSLKLFPVKKLSNFPLVWAEQ